MLMKCYCALGTVGLTLIGEKSWQPCDRQGDGRMDEQTQCYMPPPYWIGCKKMYWDSGKLHCSLEVCHAACEQVLISVTNILKHY